MAKYGVIWIDRDDRFNPHKARIRSRGNETIRNLYLDRKALDDNAGPKDWRLFWEHLWYCYFQENPALWDVLVCATGFGEGEHNYVDKHVRTWEALGALQFSHRHLRTQDTLAGLL